MKAIAHERLMRAVKVYHSYLRWRQYSGDATRRDHYILRNAVSQRKLRQFERFAPEVQRAAVTYFNLNGGKI